MGLAAGASGLGRKPPIIIAFSTVAFKLAENRLQSRGLPAIRKAGGASLRSPLNPVSAKLSFVLEPLIEETC